MTLRTLKDIFLWKEGKDFNPKLCASNKELLRMEAKEWIKELNKAKLIHQMNENVGDGVIEIIFVDGEEVIVTPKEACLLQQLHHYKRDNVGLWIKHFFNLEGK